MQWPEGHRAQAGDKGNAGDRKAEGQNEEVGIGKHACLRMDRRRDCGESLQLCALAGAEQRPQLRQRCVETVRRSGNRPGQDIGMILLTLSQPGVQQALRQLDAAKPDHLNIGGDRG